MKLTRRYILETRDGKWEHWDIKKRRGPQVDEFGFVLLKKGGKSYGKYAVDPKKFRRMGIYSKISKRWLKNYIHVQIWQEGESNPLDFFYEMGKQENEDFTPNLIATMGKSKKIDKLMNAKNQFDIMKLALLAALAIAGMAVYALVVSK